MTNDADLHTLGHLLMLERTPDDSMGLSDLDGILIGSELVLPSKWLPHVWGGEALTFVSVGWWPSCEGEAGLVCLAAWKATAA